MKSYQYTAKNEMGEKVTGVINSFQFEDASQQIRSKGLELISLEEVEEQIIKDLRPYVFEAIDSDGEEVEGSIKATDEASATRQIQQQFGVQPRKIHEKKQQLQSETTPQPSVTAAKKVKENHSETLYSKTTPKQDAKEATPPPQPQKEQTQQEDHILFGNTTKEASTGNNKSHDQLQSLEDDIDAFLREKADMLSESTRERLLHLSGKIDLLRESPDKRRFRNLKRELKRVKKIAEREIKTIEQEKWDSYEQQKPGENIESYAEFEQERKKQKKQQLRDNKLSRWLQIVDLPNEENEEEVLVKQQYESIWAEVQRFTAVLFGFYLLVFFAAYYLKRSGIEEHFLVRIFDTTLFKQLVLVLFTLFTLLSIRQDFLPKRIKSDVGILVIWLACIWWAFW